MSDGAESDTGNTEVRDFYDEFRDTRMIGYRFDGSRRIDAAIDAAKRLLRPGAVVADIGCGIGMFAEAMAAHEPSAKVIAVDLSPSNIEYAKRTVTLPNVKFAAVDVTGQFEVVRQMAEGPADLLCLIDVIEHIPEKERGALFQSIAEVAGKNAQLFLAYPSPEYQRHLIDNDPGELQVIDNVVLPANLIAEAAAAGWSLREFRYVDMWRRNQYIHAVFVRTLSVDTMPFSRPGLIERIRNGVDRYILRPQRVKRYGA